MSDLPHPTTVTHALTLWRPWDWCFPHADKDVENRSCPPPRRIVGRWLALHAGKRWDSEAFEAFKAGDFGELARACPPKEQHPDSVIGSVVYVSGWADLRPRPQVQQVSVGQIVKNPQFVPSPPSHPSLWAFGPVCWDTPHCIELPAPVLCRGAQGVWHLPPDVLQQVRAQLRHAHSYRCASCGWTRLSAHERPRCRSCVISQGEKAGEPVVLYRTDLETREESFLGGDDG